MAFPVHSTVTKIVETADGFGSAWIDPSQEVVAGEFGTWRLTYEAGTKGVAAGGRLRIRTDSDTDWGVPQFLDPSAEDCMTVTAPDGVRCSVQVGGPKSLALRIHGRPLKTGERITLTLGDTSGGSPGSRAQTFLERRHDFLFEIDAEGNGNSVLLAQSPYVTIVGGPAERLVLVAPSSVVVGESFKLIVKAEDRWGNSSSSFEGTVALSGDEINLPTKAMQFETQTAVPPRRKSTRKARRRHTALCRANEHAGSLPNNRRARESRR